MSVISEAEAGGANVCAFLDMIAWCEGTDKPGTDHGYNVAFGGRTFAGYDKHPNIVTPFGKGQSSSAAGRYQFLFRTWNGLGLPNFQPINQDRGAITLLKQRKAYDLVVDGRFNEAVAACNREWASFYGSPYGQRTRSLDDMRRHYLAAGGCVG